MIIRGGTYIIDPGGEGVRTERAKLRPGEYVFVLRPNGEYETMGVVDSRGEPPPPEVII